MKLQHTFTTGKGLDEEVVKKYQKEKMNLNGYQKKD